MKAVYRKQQTRARYIVVQALIADLCEDIQLRPTEMLIETLSQRKQEILNLMRLARVKSWGMLTGIVTLACTGSASGAS